jgi:pyruvate/2-oxoglutarate dehydrogenase complex dihydrolipoamide acyltransferase (E2) component
VYIVVNGDFLGGEEEAEVAAWLVQGGDVVAAGQPIAEIETNKASAEFPAPAAGTIELLVAAGALIEPGAVIARLA